MESWKDLPFIVVIEGGNQKFIYRIVKHRKFHDESFDRLMQYPIEEGLRRCKKYGEHVNNGEWEVMKASFVPVLCRNVQDSCYEEYRENSSKLA